MVCILTGHELKDPNATVKYHTGIDMKAAQDTRPVADAHGRLTNQPIPVPDDLEAIIAAIGAEVGAVEVAGDGGSGPGAASEVPVSEY